MKLLVTGSAPISRDVANFLKCAFCVPIMEGYGQTEVGGACVATHESDPMTQHVGGPTGSGKIRLRDVPEMGYLATDRPPRGEIQFFGPCVFKGYFKNEEKTKEAFDEDGWLNSGDVGTIFENGSIKIIDRAKNIFKLSQGEYIAPEKLENCYVQSPLVAQIFVYGNSLQNHLVAIVVVDPDVLPKWAEEN